MSGGRLKPRLMGLRPIARLRGRSASAKADARPKARGGATSVASRPKPRMHPGAANTRMIDAVSPLDSMVAERRERAAPANADSGMAEVLRLIRVSLLLRLLPSFIALIGALSTGAPITLLVALVLVLPSLSLFVIASVVARTGNVRVHQVRILLMLTLAVYAIEFAVAIAVSVLMQENALAWLGSALPNFQPQQVNTSAPIPLLFLLIPTVLGAWVDGRRGWWKWAGILIALTAIAALAFELAVPNSTLGLFSFVALALVALVVCYFVGSLADQQRAEHVQLELANRRLAEQAFVREQLATSRERMRLSRDLHDTVAHKLAALSVQMNAIDAVLRDPAADTATALREVERARVLVREGLDDARHAIGDLRANPVDDLGLPAALARLADAVSQRGGLDVSFEQRGADPALPADAANALYLIVQEALNNVERHAQAHHAVVTFDGGAPDRPVVSVRVADDGIGFDPMADPAGGQRFGLTGMRERAELIGAHLRVDSAVDAGTRVTASLRY
jgi:signal transduction histidine kinase